MGGGRGGNSCRRGGCYQEGTVLLPVVTKSDSSWCHVTRTRAAATGKGAIGHERVLDEGFVATSCEEI
jgi:hypothetical protein